MENSVQTMPEKKKSLYETKFNEIQALKSKYFNSENKGYIYTGTNTTTKTPKKETPMRNIFKNASPILSKEEVEMIMKKNGKSYSFGELTKKEARTLRTIVKGKFYRNMASQELPNPFVIIDLFMRDNIYAFGGLMIWNRYGLTEQVAVWGTVYNTKYSGRRNIAGTPVIFIKVSNSYFFGVERKTVKQ